MQDLQFLCYILNNILSEGSNSVHLSEQLAILYMISEEHWENDELLFQNLYEHREAVNLRI